MKTYSLGNNTYNVVLEGFRGIDFKITPLEVFEVAIDNNTYFSNKYIEKFFFKEISTGVVVTVLVSKEDTTWIHANWSRVVIKHNLQHEKTIWGDNTPTKSMISTPFGLLRNNSYPIRFA
jgi:hypothetical protein